MLTNYLEVGKEEKMESQASNTQARLVLAEAEAACRMEQGAPFHSQQGNTYVHIYEVQNLFP